MWKSRRILEKYGAVTKYLKAQKSRPEGRLFLFAGK